MFKIVLYNQSAKYYAFADENLSGKSIMPWMNFQYSHISEMI
jgi:hypothetical protein